MEALIFEIGSQLSCKRLWHDGWFRPNDSLPFYSGTIDRGARSRGKFSPAPSTITRPSLAFYELKVFRTVLYQLSSFAADNACIRSYFASQQTSKLLPWCNLPLRITELHFSCRPSV